MEKQAEYEIKPARSADFPVVADIYNEYIRRGDATMDETLKTADDIAGWVAHFHEREFLYVLSDGDAVIGWGIIKRYSDREGYRFACETAVYLRSDALGRGLGTRFKRYLIDRCRELGYHHLVAKIFADNLASIHYNLKLGYAVVGTQKEIGFKNGRWQDVVILQLLLDQNF